MRALRRLAMHGRVERLIDDAIERFELDLTGMTVLTETASGPFVTTPLIAARAGGSVVAVTRDSRYGRAEAVERHTTEWAERLGVADAIDIHVGRGRDRAGDVELVTNLGFVRPIDAPFLSRLKPGAVVSLMCEPWEIRPEDVDLDACRSTRTPVLGTDEQDPRVGTFRFVGMLALKLLLDLEIEVLSSRIVVAASDPFAAPIVDTLRDLGAAVTLVDGTIDPDLRTEPIIDACRQADAVVVAEHRSRRTVVGGPAGLPLDVLEAAGAVVAHISGAVDDPETRLTKHPAGNVRPGWMAVTTDMLGPRPVVDLHTAGLRVGQALVRAMRRFGDAAQAEALALRESPAVATAEAR